MGQSKHILPIGDIVRSKELQLRRLDPEYVEEIAAAYKAKDELPAPRVWLIKGRPNHFLTRGFHRVAGAEAAGLRRIECEVKSGTLEEAFEDALSGNQGNGRRFNNKEKRHAVKLALKSFPDWSDRRIAAALGVTHPFVAEIRVVTVTTDGKKTKEKPSVLKSLQAALIKVIHDLPDEQTANAWLDSVTDGARAIVKEITKQGGLFDQ